MVAAANNFMTPARGIEQVIQPEWTMDVFYERVIVGAATIDELLSDDFKPLHGQKGDADLAARRLAAWCRSCASGDWSLFGRRLERIITTGTFPMPGAGRNIPYPPI